MRPKKSGAGREEDDQGRCLRAAQSPVKKAFPEHLPRERVVVEAPQHLFPAAESDRIVKMGEDFTETLEVVPRQWKVIQTVREKFTCPGLREDLPAPPHPSIQSHGDGPAPSLLANDRVREIRPASAPLNRPGRTLRPRGRGPQPLHARRPGWRGGRVAEAAERPDRGACLHRGPAAW